jgi:hypothetical protein
LSLISDRMSARQIPCPSAWMITLDQHYVQNLLELTCALGSAKNLASMAQRMQRARTMIGCACLGRACGTVEGCASLPSSARSLVACAAERGGLWRDVRITSCSLYPFPQRCFVSPLASPLPGAEQTGGGNRAVENRTAKIATATAASPSSSPRSPRLLPEPSTSSAANACMQWTFRSHRRSSPSPAGEQARRTWWRR